MILVTFLLVGCDRDEGIAVYQAPKDPVMPVADRPVAPASAGAGALTWTVPDGWKPLPAQQMRFASFAVSDTNPPVELTVIPLGLEAGDVTANVNRWEGQLGLPPTPKEKIAELIKHQHGELEIDAVDLSSADKKQRMLGAIVPYGGKVWFFKMLGPTDIVEKQKANFDAFLASLKPGQAGGAPAGDPHAAGAPNSPVPMTGPMTGPKDAPVAREPISTIKSHTAPEGWTAIPDAKPPRMLAYKIGAAEMIVTRFAPGNTGTFLDNVNRWRMQLGLGPVEDAQASTMSDVTVGKDGQGIMVDVENPDSQPPKKTLVVIASAKGDLWFFKLTGPSDAVTKQRDAFVQFMKSVEFAGVEGAGVEGNAK